ncbi:MAG: cadherin-like beta sandwich domain-containing protein [Aminipila sp.]
MKKILSLLVIVALLMTSGITSFAASSADESLDKLSVSKSKSSSSSKTYEMLPRFDPEIADYYVFLPEDFDYAYIYMKPESKSYKVYCDGEEVDDDDDYYAYIKNISNEDDIDIVVRDKNDDKLDTYTITFLKGREKDNDEARLSDLYVKTKDGRDSYSKVSLNKEFDRSEDSYSVSVKENDYDSIRIYAEPKDSSAYTFINGEWLKKDEYVDVKVEKGKNEFKINVVAENCEDTEEYTLTVNYDTTDTDKKAEAILSTLSVKDNLGNNIALSPMFNSGKKHYTASVGSHINSVNFYTTTGNNTSMYLNNTQLKSSIWSQNYNLVEGMNTFTITAYLTGDSYDTKTYSVNVFKYPKKIEAYISAQKLNINGISKQLKAYNIAGNNFVKLRDIASLLAGTNKQFSIGYNELSNSISLLSGGYYTPNGQENSNLLKAKEIMISIQPVTLDNQQISLTSYNIDGNNFVMLRDLALLLNFGLTYNSATDTIQVSTNSAYMSN